MTTLYFLMAMSGVPSNDLTFFLKRRPLCQSSFVTIPSSLEMALMACIVFLLCSFVMVSVIAVPRFSSVLFGGCLQETLDCSSAPVKEYLHTQPNLVGD